MNKRHSYIDNAKGILIFLVVLGHLVSPYRGEDEMVYYLNNILASFRMPALILLTGYMTKNFRKKGRVEKLLVKLIFPYLIFQGLNGWYHHGWNIRQWNTWEVPYIGLWFLVGLFAWNLLLYVFDEWKYPTVMAFVVGIGIGSLQGGEEIQLIMRIGVFFPFFWIGHQMTREHLQLLRSPMIKKLSIIGMVILCFLFWWLEPHLVRELLLGKWSYQALGLTVLEGFFYRSLSYIMMLTGLMMFLALVPHEEWIGTLYGKKTVYVYLLHFWFIKWIHQISWFQEYERGKLLLFPLLAGLLVYLLQTKWIIQFTRPVVEGEIIDTLMNGFKQWKKGKERKYSYERTNPDFSGR